MSKPDVPIRTAIHESAHAVLLMAQGYTPLKIVSQGKRGGQVESLASIPGDVQALSAVAGALAERTILNCDDAVPSVGDVNGMHAASQQQSKVSDRQYFAWCETRSGQILFEHEDAVIELANCLLQTPVMTADQLGEACRRGKALRKFAGLFPKPKPAAMRTSKPAAQPSVDRGGDVDLADLGLTRADLTAGGMRPDLAAILSSR